MLQEFAGCDYVVVPSGSCGGMIKAHYPELLSEFPELKPEVDRLVARTWELADFLVNVLGCESGARPLPGQRHLSRLLFRVARAGCESAAATAPVARYPAYSQGNGHAGPVLRIRWHLRRQVRRYLVARIADQKCTTSPAPVPTPWCWVILGCMLNIEGRLRRRGDTRTEGAAISPRSWRAR